MTNPLRKISDHFKQFEDFSDVNYAAVYSAYKVIKSNEWFNEKNIETLPEQFNIDLYKDDTLFNENVYGATLAVDGKHAIVINSELQPFDQKLTIGHELAHVLLEHDNSDASEYEAECYSLMLATLTSKQETIDQYLENNPKALEYLVEMVKPTIHLFSTPYIGKIIEVIITFYLKIPFIGRKTLDGMFTLLLKYIDNGKHHE